MICQRCGINEAPNEPPGAGLCWPCFQAAVDELTAAINAAPGPGAATVIFLEGMRALGAERDALMDIVWADMQEA